MLENMLVLTRNLFIAFLISVVNLQTITSHLCSEQLNNIAPLIEAQSMGRIVNRPFHGSETDDQLKESNTVIFEGTLKDSHLPLETHSTRLAEVFEKSKEDQETLSLATGNHNLPGGSLTTFNNVILNQRQEYVTNQALFNNNQNVHIHHHHYVILNKNKKNSLDEQTPTGESSEKHFQPVLSTMPYTSSPDLFTLVSQGQTGEINPKKDEPITNIPHFDQSPQSQELSYDHLIPIDIRKSDKTNGTQPPLENDSKGLLDDHGKNEMDLHQSEIITLKISTLPPSDNEHSEYDVPLN